LRSKNTPPYAGVEVICRARCDAPDVEIAGGLGAKRTRHGHGRGILREAAEFGKSLSQPLAHGALCSGVRPSRARPRRSTGRRGAEFPRTRGQIASEIQDDARNQARVATFSVSRNAPRKAPVPEGDITQRRGNAAPNRCAPPFVSGKHRLVEADRRRVRQWRNASREHTSP